MNHIIENIFESYRDKVVISDNDCDITYGDLQGKIFGVLEYLKEKDLVPGDKVIASLPNSIDLIALYFACMYGGYTIIPLNPALDKKEIQSIFDKVYAKIIIDESFPYAFSLNSYSLPDTNFNYLICFTSGSTGDPKGVCHSLERLVRNAIAFNKVHDLCSDLKMLHVMPMTYMAGFLNTVLSPFLVGGTIVIGDKFSAKSALTFWETVDKGKVNSIWLSPSMLAILNRLPASSLLVTAIKSKLKYVFVGTAPLLEQERALFQHKFDIKCLESYGMTELLLISSQTLEQGVETGSVGKKVGSINYLIKDVEGNRVHDKQNGQLWIKSPTKFLGYYSESEQSCDIDGFFPTGDLASVDSDENLFITGRVKDLIIKGGVNISPQYLENYITKDNFISEVAVVGRPHPVWGEVPIAFIVMKTNESINVKELTMQYKLKLKDRAPDEFVLVNELPKSDVGKVLKGQLKAMLT